jgi:hypothetical protein
MPVVIEAPISPPLPPLTEDASNLWELLYESMGYHLESDEENDFALRKLCEALCFPMQPIYDLVRERDGQKGCAMLLDPDQCPVQWLPYLAQWVGAVLTPGMSEEQRRLEIKEPTSWKRGQVPSIELIAKRESSVDDPWVRVRSRFPGPGEIYIRRLASETPNPARVETELLEHGVPAWELLDFGVIEGVTVADVAASEKWTTVADLAAAFATVDDLAHILPDEI